MGIKKSDGEYIRRSWQDRCIYLSIHHVVISVDKTSSRRLSYLFRIQW